MTLNETPSRRLILLVPSRTRIPASFRQRETNYLRYGRLLQETQRLRGQLYLQDGAINESSLVDGRHESELDHWSCHLLVLNAEDRVCGCARFHEHPRPVVFSELNVARSALAGSPEWGRSLNAALEAELVFSRDLDLPFVELGGWALDQEIRGTTEALRMALATYAFWDALGGAVCLSAATRRHCSATILRRIGGRVLNHEGSELPAYYDPQYNCEMEILRFYSWAPNPRYAPWIHRMKQELSRIPILTAHSGLEEWPSSSTREDNLSRMARAQIA